MLKKSLANKAGGPAYLIFDGVNEKELAQLQRYKCPKYLNETKL